MGCRMRSRSEFACQAEQKVCRTSYKNLCCAICKCEVLRNKDEWKRSVENYIQGCCQTLQLRLISPSRDEMGSNSEVPCLTQSEKRNEKKQVAVTEQLSQRFICTLYVVCAGEGVKTGRGADLRNRKRLFRRFKCSLAEKGGIKWSSSGMFRVEDEFKKKKKKESKKQTSWRLERRRC